MEDKVIMEDSQKVALRYNPEKPSRVFHASWYKDQMSGWSKASYILVTIGIAFLLFIGLKDGITPLGLTSTIAGIIGFTCTVSITNGKPINGILGFISALMLSYVALQTGNYSDIIMQCAYIGLLDIPVLLSRSWGNFKAKTIKGTNITLNIYIPKSIRKRTFFHFTFTMKSVLFTVLMFVIFLALTYILDAVILHSPQAMLDAIAATIGLTGAILTTMRFKETYYFWLAQGLMSVALWAQTAMNGHAVWVLFFTYMLYIANDFVAFFDSQWFEKGKKKQDVEVAQ